MASSVNIGGAWKKLSKIWCNVAGTWRQVTKAHCNVGGTWRQWFTGAEGAYLYKKNLFEPTERSIYLINYSNHTLTGEKFSLVPEANTIFLSSDEAFFNGYTSGTPRVAGIGKFDISTGAELSFRVPPETVDTYGGCCGCSENYIYAKATSKFSGSDQKAIILQLDKATLAYLTHFYLVESSGGGYARQVTGSAGQLFCSDHQSGASPGWWNLILRDEVSKSRIKTLAYGTGGSSGSRDNFMYMGCDKNFFYSRRGGYSSGFVMKCGKYDRNTAALISDLLGVANTVTMTEGNIDGFKN